MSQFYIADWHYGHKNCIAFDNRPFASVEEMNLELIRRWNKVVSDKDTVYILGDMFWCGSDTAIPVLAQLNGTKILIKGNHDRIRNSDIASRFAQIVDYLEIKDGDRDIVLCHYPIPCFKNHYYGWHHLYGHVHTSFEANMMERVKWEMRNLYDKQCLMFNVGAMMPWMDYTPRTLDEILAGANAEGPSYEKV